MSATSTCRCCGCPVHDQRAAIRRCIVCDLCDRRHGDELQAIILDLLSRGEIDPGLALARMMLDDAHHAGMLHAIVDTDGRTAQLRIPVPVPRWRVYAGRQKLADRPIEAQVIVDLAVAPYWGLRPTDHVLAKISADITAAMTFLGLVVDGVSITPTSDHLGPGMLAIHISAHDRPDPEQVITPAPEVEIPDDIMQRARGQA